MCRWKKTVPQSSLFNGSPNGRAGLPLHELLSREAPKEPQATKVITVGFTCTPEADGKFLLLKTSQTLAVRQRTWARTEADATFLLAGLFFSSGGDIR